MHLALVVDRGKVVAGVHAILGCLYEKLQAGDAGDSLHEVRQLTGDFENEDLLRTCGWFAGCGDAAGLEGCRDPLDRWAETLELPFGSRPLEFRPR
jgi:hypothetical protein